MKRIAKLTVDLLVADRVSEAAVERMCIELEDIDIAEHLADALEKLSVNSGLPKLTAIVKVVG